MTKSSIGRTQLKLVDDLVNHYTENRHLFEVLLRAVETSVSSSKKLQPPLIHSTKARLKDPDHLRYKLVRKIRKAQEEGKGFDINIKNLFSKINDLAGFRIIHLHTTQFEEINQELKKICNEQAWVVQEGPIARSWDDEYRDYFRQIKVDVNDSPDFYTSVHYVIKANSTNPVTCEIQVRTLMEEVWGEVNHTINYPDKSKSFSCREQIKVLARVTSSSSRLVDSIFSTYSEFNSKLEVPKKLKPARKSSGK